MICREYQYQLHGNFSLEPTMHAKYSCGADIGLLTGVLGIMFLALLALYYGLGGLRRGDTADRD